jgi:hypothetical protein
MSASVCAGLHFPPLMEVSQAYATGQQWKMMYNMAIRFIAVNIADTAYKLYEYTDLFEAMRSNMKEMLSLIGMMAAQ